MTVAPKTNVLPWDRLVDGRASPCDPTVISSPLCDAESDNNRQIPAEIRRYDPLSHQSHLSLSVV